MAGSLTVSTKFSWIVVYSRYVLDLIFPILFFFLVGTLRIHLRGWLKAKVVDGADIYVHMIDIRRFVSADLHCNDKPFERGHIFTLVLLCLAYYSDHSQSISVIPVARKNMIASIGRRSA